MGFLDSIRTEYRALSTRQQQPIIYKAASESMPAWLQATGEANRHEIFYSPEQQARLYTQLSWIQIATNMVATTAIIPDLTIKTQKAVDDTERDIDNHPFETLLQHPNPDQSRSEFIESTVSFRTLSGNAFWWLNKRNEKAPPDELWIVPSQQIRPAPDGKLYIRGYFYDPGDGNEIFLEPWEIVHFKRFNPLNRFIGLSVVDALRMVSIGDLAAQRWNTNYFDKHNAKLPGALAFADPIDDDAWRAMRADIDNEYGGTNRKVMLMRNVGKGGVEWINMAMSQKDMEFLAGRQFTKEEIYDAIAPGLSSMLAVNSTEANSITGKKTLIEYAVWPNLIHISEKITQTVLKLYGENLKAEFEDIRITDRELTLKEQAAYSAVHTIDEIRNEFYGDEQIGDERGNLLIAEVIPLARTSTGSNTVLDIPADTVPGQAQPATPTQNVTVAQPAALLTDSASNAADTSQPAKALKAASAQMQTGCMVAFFILPDVARDLVAVQQFLPLNSAATPSSEFHITLCYLGDMADMDTATINAINNVLYEFSATMPPLTGRFNGIGRFQGVGDGGADALYVSFDCKELPDWRHELIARLRYAKVDLPSEHGFIPHITLGYIPSNAVTPLISLPLYDMTFSDVWACFGGNRQNFRLSKPQVVDGQVLSSQVLTGADELAAETKRFRAWLKKRKNPDVTKFDSSVLTAEQKAKIYAETKPQEDGADQHFFTLMDGKATHNIPGQDGNDKQRVKLEKEHAGKIAKVLKDLLDKVIPRNAQNVTADSVWNRYKKNQKPLKEAVSQMLIDGAVLGAEMGKTQVEAISGKGKAPSITGVDWEMVNQNVLAWVNGGTGDGFGTGYADELTSLLAQHSEGVIRTYIADWIESGEPLSTLIDRMSQTIFSEQRAQDISVTEVTRAYATGNRDAWRASGYISRMRWLTAVDELVCQICNGLHQQEAEIDGTFDGGYFPPAHPRCRCIVVPVA